MSKQDCKVFIGGLSWETTGEKLRAYFENYGAVREAFVSYNRNNGRPRGFGFVVFESPEIADKVVATKHTIDRREVEAKKAVPKDDSSAPTETGNAAELGTQKTRKIFVGGLAPGVDDAVLRQYFEQFGEVEDAVVMYDHDNKRPRGFGFVCFAQEEAVDKVFGKGTMQCILEKQIEIKPAVPRDQMPAAPRGLPPGNYYHPSHMLQYRPVHHLGPFGTPARPYGYSLHVPLGAPYPVPHNAALRPPTYPSSHQGYLSPQALPSPPLSGASRPPGPPPPSSHTQPQQFTSSMRSSPPVSMPLSLNAALHQQQPSSDIPGQPNTGTFSSSGTGAASLQTAQQQAAAVAAANGFGDMYALSNGGSTMFATSAQAAALYNMANGGFPPQLNGMQSSAADVSSKLNSLGQQGLSSLKALAAGYNAYSDSQRAGTYDDDSAYAGDADVFAEQISTRMAGLAVGGGEYGSPFTSANTIGSGWSH